MKWEQFRSLFRALRLLSNTQLVQDLSRRTEHLRQIQDIRSQSAASRIDSNIVLNSYEKSRLQLGGRVSICAGTVLSFGDEHNGFGQISIGDSTWIGQYNNLRAGGGAIQIGRGCLISQFCTLVATNHGTNADQPIASQPPQNDRMNVILENDVWLGAGVTILPGVVVREGAVIGAGSVVTKEVPPGEIHAGIPAKRIGTRLGTS